MPEPVLRSSTFGGRKDRCGAKSTTNGELTSYLKLTTRGVGSPAKLVI
jgi:hypothetical protein